MSRSLTSHREKDEAMSDDVAARIRHLEDEVSWVSDRLRDSQELGREAGTALEGA
jgi:hypothetical protein